MVHKYLKDVATVALDSEKCIGCGRCLEVCPHGVFVMESGKESGKEGGKAIIVQKDRCMECGACALNCPAGALSVHAGVGCAAAVIYSWISGNEPTCDCSGGECC